MSFKIGEDILDTRDLIQYLEELKDNFLSSYNEVEGVEDVEDFDEIDEGEVYENAYHLMTDLEDIQHLQSFHDELEGYGDFEYGATLIHRDYFTDYCKDLLEDCGDLPRDLPFYIENNINWGGVANDLEMDYTSATIDNQEYLMRE